MAIPIFWIWLFISPPDSLNWTATLFSRLFIQFRDHFPTHVPGALKWAPFECSGRARGAICQWFCATPNCDCYLSMSQHECGGFRIVTPEPSQRGIKTCCA
jgi:hypothetical protein